MPKERAAGERRVALVPELVSRLVADGFEILVEQGAGDAASFPDAAYEEASAQVVADVYGDADAVAKVQKPSEDEAGRLRDGQVLIGFLQPLTDPEGIARLFEVLVEQGAGDAASFPDAAYEEAGARVRLPTCTATPMWWPKLQKPSEEEAGRLHRRPRCLDRASSSR